MKGIAYYITAHGYGHGTRSCDVLNALRAAAPGIPITIKTDLPPDFLLGRLGNGFEIRPGAFDIGLIQKDSIQVDLEASIEALEQLYVREEDLIEQERVFFDEEEIGVVVADVPAIPLAAAQRSRIPDIATANFGWDWIYSDFIQYDSRWEKYVDKFRNVYEKTSLLLRQPFAEPMAAFPTQIDLPLLAKPGQPRRERISDVSGADPSKPWILLSFTTLDLNKAALRNLEQLRDYELFTVDPLRWEDSRIHCISRAAVCFADILASCDLVVTKPGFGILSECIANKKPIIYADRKHFLEYAVLVENIERYCCNAFLPSEELYAGNLVRAIEKVQLAPTPPPDIMESGGAERAASEILKRLS